MSRNNKKKSKLKCEPIAHKDEITKTNNESTNKGKMIGRNNRKMICFVCVLWCLIFNASAGHLAGDPAPGRSPGPPSSSETIANAIWLDGNHRDNDDNRNSMDAVASSHDNVVRVDQYDDVYHKSSDEIHQVPHANTMNRQVTTKVSASKPIKQPDKLVDKLTNEFVNHKPCKNLSVNEYLLLKKHSPEIVKLDKSSAAMRNNKTSPSSVSIDVIHNAFDLNYGLVRNVIYTGNEKIAFGIFNYTIFHISLAPTRSDSNACINTSLMLRCAPIISRTLFLLYSKSSSDAFCIIARRVPYVPLPQPKSVLLLVSALGTKEVQTRFFRCFVFVGAVFMFSFRIRRSDRCHLWKIKI